MLPKEGRMHTRHERFLQVTGLPKPTSRHRVLRSLREELPHNCPRRKHAHIRARPDREEHLLPPGDLPILPRREREAVWEARAATRETRVSSPDGILRSGETAEPLSTSPDAGAPPTAAAGEFFRGFGSRNGGAEPWRKTRGEKFAGRRLQSAITSSLLPPNIFHIFFLLPSPPLPSKLPGERNFLPFKIFVSDEGDVLYVFPRDYRAKLTAKSFKMKIEPLFEKSKAAVEYLIRVSFGTALIASIVLVYTTIIAIISSRSDEDNRGRRGGRAYDSGFTLFFRPSDLFWYWDPYYYKRQQMRTNEGMNFIESVFSFVFGDGDPNQGLEEERWKLVGEYIALNGGVVTGEELAPYLDVFPTDENLNDESYILPVLLRFDGHPEVDDEGNILYRFPSLQRTASPQRVGRKEYVGKRWTEWVGGVRKFFEEKKWVFSKTGTSERAMVIGLGGLNLFGVIVLGTMLKTTAIRPGGLISFVADIFPLLQIYAASFFAIPLARWFLVRKRNAGIEQRNRTRKQRAQALQVPDSSLRRKVILLVNM
ncbi:hypothetical protein Taro_029130, partial [Colocasia esculenta]|nr:hypothetical protein [Colocasia esculenta]